MDFGKRRVPAGMIPVVLIVIVLCAFFATYMYRYGRHQRVSGRMDTAILRLALNRPDDLTDDQWAYCILWTWNLHCNCGVLPSLIPTTDLERIATELESKIDAGPNLDTIDWLWDEYVQSAPGAHNYERFRPTSPDNQSELEVGAHAGNPLSKWCSKYERWAAKK